MKKLLILLAVASLVFASCDSKGKQVTDVVEETCCALTAEQQEMFDNWEIWADLTEEQQMALVVDMKAYFDECKAKCEAKCAKEKSEEAEEVCPAKKAACEEFAAQWENFENLDLATQKALIDKIIEHKKCCKEKETACKHDAETGDKE